MWNVSTGSKHRAIAFTLNHTVVGLKANQDHLSNKGRCSELQAVATLAATLCTHKISTYWCHQSRETKSLVFGVCPWQKGLCWLSKQTKKCCGLGFFDSEQLSPFDRKPIKTLLFATSTQASCFGSLKEVLKLSAHGNAYEMCGNEARWASVRRNLRVQSSVFWVISKGRKTESLVSKILPWFATLLEFIFDVHKNKTWFVEERESTCCCSTKPSVSLQNPLWPPSQTVGPLFKCTASQPVSLSSRQDPVLFHGRLRSFLFSLIESFSSGALTPT